MESFYNGLGPIIGFLIVVVIFQNVSGNKITGYMMLLVFMGMILFNVKPIQDKLTNLAKSIKGEE